MNERISLSQFAEMIYGKSQVMDFTRVDSVGTSYHDGTSYHVIFLKDDYGRESRIEIPYFDNNT